MSAGFRVYLVRHGEAAASWDTAPDPALSAEGARQAAEVGALLSQGSRAALWSSPLQRAQQTAQPLAEAWQSLVRIEDAVRELPSAGVPMESRRDWLKAVMRARWDAVEAPLREWRERAWQVLCGVDHDVVVFTHFMVINAIVSRATEDARTVCFEPDYCSVTTLSLADGVLRLETLGRERPTLINL